MDMERHPDVPNQMTDSRELFISTLKMEQSSYVPLFPRDLTLGMDVPGVRTDSVFGPGTYDHELSARCVLSLRDLLGSDCTVGCIFTYGLEAFGGLTKFPSDGIPYVSEYPFADIGRLDLCEPSEITDGYLFKGMRRSCETVREERPDLALMSNVPGPMTMTGFCRGVETLMMDLVLNPDIAKRLVDFSVRAISEEMIGLSEGIADGVFFASATDNPDMIGDAFLEYTVPAIKELNSKCQSNGLLTVFHPHGIFSTEDREHMLRASIGTGIDGFQFSEGNVAEDVAEICRGRCCILGGVDAYSTLLLGPDSRVVRDTERFLNAMDGMPYIMTCSCSVNRGLPLGNLRIMADTVHRHNGGDT